jgi:Fe-S-cluster containining protein
MVRSPEEVTERLLALIRMYDDLPFTSEAGLCLAMKALTSTLDLQEVRRELFLGLVQDTFVCQRCGGCCSDPPVTWQADEVVVLAKHLGLTREELLERHDFRSIGSGLFDLHFAERCPFLGDGHCTIYGIRPIVCRAFPFELGTVVKPSGVVVPQHCVGREHYDRMHKLVFGEQA